MSKPAMEAAEPASKRVKLAHGSLTHGHARGRGHSSSNAAMQRRLRKMSQEFAPSSCRFLVQARVLCVGTAVVYRVVLTLATACAAASGSTGTGEGGQAWIIAMSQTKFCSFFAQVGAILQQNVVQHYLGCEHTQQDGEQAQESEWKPFQRFLSELSAAFRRFEHLQTAAFAIQADANTMQTGRLELERFLGCCWRALELLMPTLVVEPYLPATLGREVFSIYLLLNDFLALPDDVLDANFTYAHAVLSLEDVEELLPSLSEHVCSICLESLAASHTRDLPSSGLTNNDQDGSSPPIVDNEFSVKLPCAHLFHENCVMAWLRHNPSCPECRASVGAEF